MTGRPGSIGVYLMCSIGSFFAGGVLAGASFPALADPAIPGMAETRALTPDGLVTEPDILPVDAAFRFNHHAADDAVILSWQVTPGYYLYRNKVRLSLGGEVIVAPLPAGVPRHDEVFGEVRVLSGLVEVHLAREDLPRAQGDELQVRYQGCADAGYCYPPQQRTVRLHN